MKEILCVVSLLVLSCVENSARFCDIDTPCVDPEAAFCDLDGAISGNSNRCISVPAVTKCDMSSQCLSSTEPVCNVASELCVQCWNDPQVDGDTACMEKNANQPFCASSGACECDADSCNDPLQSIYDLTNKQCRKCVTHDECKSGVCELDTGECIDESLVAYIDTLGTGLDCTLQEPCSSLSQGAEIATRDGRTIVFAQPGNYFSMDTASISGLRVIGHTKKDTVFLHTIGLASGAKLESVTVNIGQVSIIGQGNQLRNVDVVATEVGVAIRVIDSQDTNKSHLQDVLIDGCDDLGLSVLGFMAGDGVTIRNCSRGMLVAVGSVEISNLTVEGSTVGEGVALSLGAEVRLSQCVVDNNNGIGVQVGGFSSNDNSMLYLTECSVTNNKGAGIQVQSSSNMEVRKTRIEGNERGGVDILEGGFLIENTLITKNSNPGTLGIGAGVSIHRTQPGQRFSFTTIWDNVLGNGIFDLFVTMSNSGSGTVEVTDSLVKDWLAIGAPNPLRASYSYMKPSTSIPIDDGGNIVEAPTFANTDNYEPASSSSVIDKASPGFTIIEDFNGTERPQGSRNDIGAQEFEVE